MLKEDNNKKQLLKQIDKYLKCITKKSLSFKTHFLLPLYHRLTFKNRVVLNIILS